MDNTTLIDQLADEVDNLFHIYQGLAGHIKDGSHFTRLRSQEVRALGTTVQRMQAYIETLASRLRDQSKGVTHDNQPVLFNTCTVDYSEEGWRVHFDTGIVPYFGLEPHRTLREVIERVATLYPDQQPRLTSDQLEDYARLLDDAVCADPELSSTAARALMRCAPADLPASKRILLEDEAEKALRTGQGLSEVVKDLTQLQQKKQHNQTYQRAQTL
jgi:hypothetical protein